MKANIEEKWGQHEDRAKINADLVPIIVVGSKFDVFANEYESLKKK